MRVLDWVKMVERQRGDKYRLGAEASPSNPNPSVWDCSEISEWAYKRAGVQIRDGAWAQYEDTKPVTKAAVGDLVFLHNNPARPHGIGHVGIITRVGKTDLTTRVVEAKGTKYGVVFSTLWAWKRKSTFASMRRHPDFAKHVFNPPAVPDTREWAWVIGGMPGVEKAALVRSFAWAKCLALAGIPGWAICLLHVDRETAADLVKYMQLHGGTSIVTFPSRKPADGSVRRLNAPTKTVL